TAEFTINNDPKQILKELFIKKPDVLCFSCYIWNISIILSIAENIKKILPETIIVLGGPEVSFDSEELLKKYPFIDFVMRGEGEYTFVRFAEYLYGKRSLKDVTGITYRDDKVIISNPSSEPVDLNKIPFVYENLDGLENRIIYYETQRGCPYSCQFCLSGDDKKLRFLDIERVKKELQFFLDNKVPQVKFVDRTFNCKKSHAMEIWKYCMENDNGITNFHMEISAEIMDDDMLELLKGAREALFQFEVGVQSTNTATLEAVKRKCNFNNLKSIVNKVHSFGNIHQHLDLIAGLPYEDYNSFRKSFNDVYSLDPQQLQLGFLKLLKGSGLRRDAEKHGIVYDEQAPYEVLFTKDMPYEDMLKLKAIEEFTETYYNSSKALNTIAYAVTVFGTPFDFYEKAGLYMDRHGYTKNQSSKQQTYTNLYEFFVNEGLKKDILNTLKELLLFDMLLNDNLKSFPYWIDEEDDELKLKKKEFFNNKELVEIYLPLHSDLTPARLSRQFGMAKFSFDISQGHFSAATPVKKQKTYIVFDYSSKNIITGLAKAIKI
ncbi:MAG: B12-binding domain-containing radical SAM protein, partial [Firmicutes bacterium]|nr:B12-binding domain-containing radical SAM protein [Bacillota bacterium]